MSCGPAPDRRHVGSTPILPRCEWGALRRVAIHELKQREEMVSASGFERVAHDGLQRLKVDRHADRQPERHAGEVAGHVARAVLERRADEDVDETCEALEVLT
jgi:hypothetical protein